MANESCIGYEVSSRCFYVYAGFGNSHVDPEGTSAGFRTSDDDSDGWKAAVGWNFLPRWFGELAWSDLGEAEISNVNPGIQATLGSAEIDYQVASLMVGRWFRAPDRHLNFFVKGGVGTILNDSNRDFVDFDQQTDLQVVFGAGAQLNSSDRRLWLRAEFDSYDRDAWYTGLSVGVRLGSNP